MLTARQLEMCERASNHVPVPEFERTSGDMQCKECGAYYYEHPQAVPHLWLTLLCNGKYVKT